MDIKQAILRRQSCRSFDKNRVVEKDKLLQIVEAGILAPSARNYQPWQLTVVGGELAPKLVKLCQIGGANEFLNDCNTLIVVSYKEPLTVAKVEGVTAQDFRPMDIGMCIMQMCLQATELGVDTCIIGRLNCPEIAKLINSDKQVALVLAVGYATDGYEVRTKKRQPINELVKFVD